MSLPVPRFLSLLLPFLLPCLSLPLPSSILISGGQSSVGGNSDVGAFARAVIAETALLTPAGVSTHPPSTGNDVLFFPQHPYSVGFTEPVSEPNDDFSSPPKPGPAPNNTQDTHGNTGAVSTPLMMAYYPAWVAEKLPPESINLSRFDWIDFGFAIPNNTYGLGWDGSDMAPSILTRLVTAAHGQGKNVKLSIGGWSGSKWFSPIMKTDAGRQAFVNNIATAYAMYGLDGIDIDWEYPSQPGDRSNYVDQDDPVNFLEFLKLLRANLPPTARISAAVQATPFADANGHPMDDVREFANVLDWLLIMNYDTWGVSSNPGPNAPLSDACGNSTQPMASASAAINAWIEAGVPPGKLVLGVPSYGYISPSTATRLRQRDQAAPPSYYVHALSDRGEDHGSVLFRELVRQGALCPDPDPNVRGAYRGCGGFTRQWDECSGTPFLYSEAGGQVIAYDDGQSLGLKSTYARQRGLLGVNMFDIYGDTDQWELTDAARQGLGVQFSHP